MAGPAKKATKKAAKKSSRGPRGPRIPLKDIRTQPVSERAVRTAPTKLTPRQEKLRKLLIATRGNLNVGVAAKELGVDRVTIWQDRRVITALSGPDQVEDWDEDAAIRRAIDFYESGLDVLMGELQRLVDYETRMRKASDQLFLDANLAKLRFEVYGLLAIWRRDLSQFLISIGLIREAPKRHILEDERISSVTTDEDAKLAVAGIRSQIEALRARREAAATAAP